MAANLIKSRMIVFLFVIPLLALAFLAVIIAQQQAMQRLQADNAELGDRIRALQVENAFYKRAYEVTLDDIRLLSRTYGGQDRYDALAADLREKELMVLGVNGSQRYTLYNPYIWTEYREKGVINTTCVATTTIDTVEDEVLLALSFTGNGSLYIDGNLVTEELSDAAISVSLPDGLHEVDVVSRQAGGELVLLRFDTLTIDGDVLFDPGTGLQTFDCKGSSPGRLMRTPGALRFILEKR